MLEIHDILVQIRILWLMDPDPATDQDPDPTPDPTSFSRDFKDEKKISYFIIITYPQAHHLQSKNFYFLLKFVFKFYFASIISVRTTYL
jgi:hypothetical protein